METTPQLSRVLDLLEQAGSRRYGAECVNQFEHALQCAELAEIEGADASLVTASLLHDLGHLLHDLGEDAAARGVDDRHQFRALHLLRRHFGEAVVEPIRLHVDAKRYLCSVQAGYREALSPASKRSLELQGGVFSPEEARHFIEQPYGSDATRLRRWDDRAKIPGKATPQLEHFTRIIERCALR